jgi:hypothetical protein
MATTTTITTAAKFLPELWTAGLLHETTEEEVVGKDFSRPQGVAKINNKIHIPKMLRISAGAYSTGTGLTYTAGTQLEVTISPVRSVAAVEVERPVYSRMDYSPNSDYRAMLKYGLAEYRDQYNAALATGLSTNQKGSALSVLDKGLLLSSQMALAISAKRAFKPGVTPWFIKMHPCQMQNALSVFDLVADSVIGTGESPLKSGWFSKILNASIDESGNVYQAGGITHNLGYVSDAFVTAFNEESTVLPEQAVELVVRLIATEEFGSSEQFDEFAVDMMTGV